MKILLINILFLWCLFCTLNTYIFATVELKTGRRNPSRYKKKLFKVYYSNLTPSDTQKTVLEDNEFLGREICHTLGTVFGAHLYHDPGEKTCDLKFFQEDVEIEESEFVSIKLGKCTCAGKKSLKYFYIREYAVDDDIAVYFVFHVTKPPLKEERLTVSFIFDSAQQIIWRDFFPLKTLESKLTPPPPEDKKDKERQNKEGSQSEITDAS